MEHNRVKYLGKSKKKIYAINERLDKNSENKEQGTLAEKISAYAFKNELEPKQ